MSTSPPRRLHRREKKEGCAALQKSRGASGSKSVDDDSSSSTSPSRRGRLQDRSEHIEMEQSGGQDLRKPSVGVASASQSACSLHLQTNVIELLDDSDDEPATTSTATKSEPQSTIIESAKVPSPSTRSFHAPTTRKKLPTSRGSSPTSSFRKRSLNCLSSAEDGNSCRRITPTNLQPDFQSKATHGPRPTEDEARTTSSPSSDEQEETFPPRWELLQRLCWKCYVPLKLKSGDFCLYATHQHTTLSVPVCVICSDEIAAVENELLLERQEEQQSEVQYCSGCAASEEDVDVLFLCDNESECNRAFCRDCVAKAHGGGTQGVEAALSLQKDGEGNVWKCPACDPPPPLKSLRVGEQSNGETKSKAPPRTEEVVIEEFQKAEAEKRHTQELLERIDQQRDAIRMECEQSGLDENDLEDKVEEELALWRDGQIKHETRVCDLVSSLQDELELTYGWCMEALYKACRLDTSSQQTDHEPSWKQAADKELARREGERGLSTFDPLDASCYKENFDEIEELGSDDDGGNDDPHSGQERKGWSRRVKPTAEAVAEALEEETEQLAKRKVSVCKTDEARDREQTLEEEREAGGCGASRIRRDHKVVIQAKKRPQQQQGRPSGSVLRPSRSSVAKDKSDPNAGASIGGATNKNECCPLRSGDARAFGSGRLPQDKLMRANTLQPRRRRSEGQPPTLPTTPDKVPTPSRRRSAEQGSFADSELVLSKSPEVSVHRELSSKLKPHQIEGVQFMWRNTFIDCCNDGAEKEYGGCILAHNMGLGKTLSAIALLHTVMNHPCLADEERTAKFRTAMLVVPVNVTANWEDEFTKWTGRLEPSIVVINLVSQNSSARGSTIKKWYEQGGALLVSDCTFQRLVDRDVSFQKYLQPDILVLDEAHTMLKNSNNATYKALSGIKTKRRIALTGSPFQNNLFEYFRMVNFVRPGFFGFSEEREFDRRYVEPIMKGVASDSSPYDVERSDRVSAQLNNDLEPIVHRKDASELRKHLPPLQQVVLHVRPSREQTRLYRAYKKMASQDRKYANFFQAFSDLKPIHNHPGTLLLSDEENRRTTCTDKDQNKIRSGNGDNIAWWKESCSSIDKLKDVENGFKVVLLLHILAFSQQLGEKVLVFSTCLKTLNYIEEILESEDWCQRVPSLAETFAGKHLGSWRKFKDYVRIDGAVNASDRGSLVTEFNKDRGRGSIQAFLISSKAGGIGINLPAASRVVLFDTHFNPTISTQAVYRAYRYGQANSVYCYRFLTEGTMEEKVYSRTVNKTGVALRVIDNKSIKRSFSEREVADLQDNLTWVQCDNCEKWRLLTGGDETATENLPDKWYCNMNVSDPENSSCEASEKTQKWYENRTVRLAEPIMDSPSKCIAREPLESQSAFPPAECEQLEEKDTILKHLLTIAETGKKSSKIVSRHYFHEALLKETAMAAGSRAKGSPEKGLEQRTPSGKRATPKKITNKSEVSESKVQGKVPRSKRDSMSFRASESNEGDSVAETVTRSPKHKPSDVTAVSMKVELRNKRTNSESKSKILVSKRRCPGEDRADKTELSLQSYSSRKKHVSAPIPRRTCKKELPSFSPSQLPSKRKVAPDMEHSNKKQQSLERDAPKVNSPGVEIIDLCESSDAFSTPGRSPPRSPSGPLNRVRKSLDI